MGKPRGTKVDEALSLMRSRNPLTAEEGFSFLRAMARDQIDRLILEFESETRHDIRCWLLELIGEARADAAFDLLVRQARSSDDALRFWAMRGLKSLDTPAARHAIFELRS